MYKQDIVLRANWAPLSAVYPYDNNITLSPVLTTWYDGYKTFHHPLYEYARDVTVNKDQELALTNEKSLFEFIRTLNGQTYVLGSYIVLSIGGRFIKTINNKLQLDYLFDRIFTREHLFRMIINSDGSISFTQGNGLYVSVQQELPFDLTLDEQYSEEDSDKQRFYFVSSENNLQMYITTRIRNPIYSSYPDSPEYFERFWSFDEPCDNSDSPSQVRAVGMIEDDDYTYENKYLFNVNGLDVYYDADGFNKDYVWTMYWNELRDKEHNIDVIHNETKSITGIKLNNLIDLPYKSKIVLNDVYTGSMEVNIANLKNVLTPEYEVDYSEEVYTYKQWAQLYELDTLVDPISYLPAGDPFVVLSNASAPVGEVYAEYRCSVTVYSPLQYILATATPSAWTFEDAISASDTFVDTCTSYLAGP
jgi:hypothetical protein